MLFNLDFTNNIILSCFFSFFLFIDLYFQFLPLLNKFLIQLFNAELEIPIGNPTKEAKAEMETRQVIVKITISKLSK